MATMPAVPLSLADARKLALHGQLLDGGSPPPGGKEGVAQAIERLGYVQIDTIAVINRAHHHTLWTRCPDYDPEMLHELQAVDRRVFEYWAHAMAVLPISDYRYYIPRMRAGGRKGAHEWRAKHGDVIKAVLERIRSEGALTSKDFEPPPGTKRGTWWDWKPTKRALELLFWQGDLMIAERRNFQKLYDLTERVLPASVDRTPPSDDECGRFQVLRALRSLGVARDREVVGFLKLTDGAVVRQALADLCDAGEVVEVEVEEAKATALYAIAEELEQRLTEPIDARVHVLSPFDGLVIQRPRTEWLFDFEYTLECYLPQAKRKHGYFVLPILFGDRLVARLDPKADRQAKKLLVKKLWIEPWFDVTEGFLSQLGESVARFAEFNGCPSVEVERVSPAKLHGAVSRCVRSAVAADEQGEIR
jgi:uncharacterized protein YcaQ